MTDELTRVLGEDADRVLRESAARARAPVHRSICEPVLTRIRRERTRRRVIVGLVSTLAAAASLIGVISLLSEPRFSQGVPSGPEAPNSLAVGPDPIEAPVIEEPLLSEAELIQKDLENLGGFFLSRFGMSASTK